MLCFSEKGIIKCLYFNYPLILKYQLKIYGLIILVKLYLYIYIYI